MAGPVHLTAGQRSSLAGDGYLLVPSLLGDAAIGRMRSRLEELVRDTVAAWAENPSLDEHEGAVSADLDRADPVFAPCHQHPLLADAATAVLGASWHSGGLSLRAPIPGCGHQGLHPDFWPGHRTRGPWQVLAAMWCVSAFTADNGPLRVIPGSHRVAEPPVDMEHGYATGMGPHPREVKVTAPAGSVILFNSAALWHSGTLNYSPAPRMAVTAYFAPGPTSDKTDE